MNKKKQTKMQRFLSSPALRLLCIRDRRKKKMKITGPRVLSRRERDMRKMPRLKHEEEEEEKDMFCYISEEILMEIHKRLPIEDVVRSIGVCKSWYSLITSPIFNSLHSKHIASTTNKGLLLVRDYHPKKPNTELYSIHFEDESFGEYKRLYFPIRSFMNDSFLRVVGCVNGVVCLSDDKDTYTNIMVLWNPSIGKFIGLPRPIFTYRTHGGFDHCVGFGFDAAANDFKVVRVVYLETRWLDNPPKVEIYEPRRGSWREVDSKGFPHSIDKRSPQVFLHRSVHWVIGCKIEYFKLRNTKNLIVSFDLRKEVFGVIKVPDSLNEHEFRQDFCVSVLGESLSLIHDSPSDDGNICCVWVMKQYGLPDSWTKLFSIDVTGAVWRVLGFRRNGEALVKAWSRYHERNLVVSFDPKSKQVGFCEEFGCWESFYADNFVESLALLGTKGDRVDTDSSDEDSCDQEEVSQEASNPPVPNNLPPVRVRAHWFG